MGGEGNPVQTIGIGNKRHTIGIGYIMVPDNVDRDDYVQNCLRRGTVSIQTEDGDVVFDCPIGMIVLQLIEFPKEARQLGSCVLYVNEFRHNKPIITDRLIKDDESTNYIENEFKLERYTENGSVSISGVARDGNLFINVFGKGENGGKIFIDVINTDSEGEFTINLKGDFNLKASGVINLGDTESEEGVEPLLLGNKTIEELDKEVQALTDLIQSIANIIPVNVTTGTPDATWATWQAAVAAITDRGDLSEVKSEKTFTE